MSTTNNISNNSDKPPLSPSPTLSSTPTSRSSSISDVPSSQSMTEKSSPGGKKKSIWQLFGKLVNKGSPSPSPSLSTQLQKQPPPHEEQQPQQFEDVLEKSSIYDTKPSGSSSTCQNILHGTVPKWTAADLEELDQHANDLSRRILSFNITFSEDDTGQTLCELWNRFEETVQHKRETGETKQAVQAEQDTIPKSSNVKNHSGGNDRHYVQAYKESKEVRITFGQFFSKFKLVYGNPEIWNRDTYEMNFATFDEVQESRDTVEKKSSNAVIIGHPPQVIQALCEIFKDVAITAAQDLGQSLQLMDDQSVFQVPEGIALLSQSLEIVCRSTVNRVFVSQHNIFPSVKTLFRSSLELLGQLAENENKEMEMLERRDFCSGVIYFVKDILGIMVSIIEHYTDPEPLDNPFESSSNNSDSNENNNNSNKTSRMDKAELFQQLGNGHHIEKWPERAIRRRMMHNLTEFEGIISSIVSALRLLDTLPCHSFLHGFDSYGLIESFLHVSMALINQGLEFDMEEACGVDRMIHSLMWFVSWPPEYCDKVSASERWNDIKVHDDFDMSSLKRRYEIQMLALHFVVEIIVKFGSSIAGTMLDMGLVERTTELGLWICFFFDMEEDAETIIQALRDNHTTHIDVITDLHGSLPSVTTSLQGGDGNLPFHRSGNLGVPIKKITNLRVQHFFECVARLVNQSILFHMPKIMFRKDQNSKTITITEDMNDKINISHHSRLVSMLLTFFIDDPHAPTHSKRAREKLRQLSDFQFYLLDTLASIIRKTPSRSLDVLIANGMYDVLFSPFFYFFGEVTENPPENQRNSSNAGVGYVHLAPLDPNQRIISRMTSQILRENVINLIHYAFTVFNRDSTEECHAILRTMEIISSTTSDDLSEDAGSKGAHVQPVNWVQHWKGCPHVIGELGAALLEILGRRQNAMKSILAQGGASIIADTFKNQQSKLQKLLNSNNGTALLDAENSDAHESLKRLTLRARNIMLKLVDSMLPMEHTEYHGDSSILDALFECFFDPHLYDFTFSRIRTLIFDATEDENLKMVIASFTNVFPNIRVDPTDEKLVILMELLQLLRDAVSRSNRRQIQRHFLHRLDKLLDLLNCPEEDFAGKSVSQHALCVSVLKTLAAVMCDNSESKQYFKMKMLGYDMLEDLILVCEKNAPSSDIFKILFDMMVDGKFAQNGDNFITNADVVSLMFKLARKCSMEFVAEFLEEFIKLTENNTNNQHNCCKIGLISLLLELVEEFEHCQASDDILSSSPTLSFPSSLGNNAFNGVGSGVCSLTIELIQILGTHSITVKELKRFFALVKRQSENVESQLLTLLLKALKKIASQSPEAFFDFNGVDSGLVLPPIEGKWPSPSRGYTIHFWVRVENIVIGTKPRLFSFLNSDGQGLEGIFEDDALVIMVHSGSGKNPTSKSSDKMRFHAGKWYHVALVHSVAKGIVTKKYEIKLFVNGANTSGDRSQLKFPIVTSSLDQCRIGTNALMEREDPLRGQMGVFMVFNEALTESTVRHIYELGPNYMSTFQQNEAILFDKSLAYLFDGNLSSKLLMCYNPRSRNGKICINNAPESSGPSEEGARILPGTQLCVTHNAKDIIGCLGGIKVLFPLFLQMDKMSHMTGMDVASYDPYRINTLLQLILDLLQSHSDNQEDMARCRGFQVIGFLLKQISPQHLTERTVSILPGILRKVNDVLYADVVNYILLNTRLWIYTSANVQISMIKNVLIAELQSEQDNRIENSRFRHVVSVQRLVDILRFYYWYDKEPEYSLGTEKICNPVTNATLGERPQEEDVIEIRSLFFRLFHLMIEGNPSMEAIQPFAYFLMTSQDDMQICEILKFLLRLMLTSNGAIIAELLAHCDTYHVFVKMVESPNESVRILAIKCIGKLLLLHAPTRLRTEATQSYGMSYIADLLSAFPITNDTYRGLRDVLLGNITVENRTEPLFNAFDDDVDRKQQYEISSVIHLIFKLVTLEKTDIQVRLSVIQDIKLQMRSPKLQDALLKQKGWQKWLFTTMTSFMTHDAMSLNTASSLRDMIIEVMSVPLFRSLTHKKYGWKRVENTIAHALLFESEERLSAHEVMGDVFLRLMTNFESFIESHQEKSFERSSPVFDNFLHLMMLVEEHLLYSQTFAHQVQQMKRSMQQLPRTDSTNTLKTLGTMKARFRRILGGQNTPSNNLSSTSLPQSPQSQPTQSSVSSMSSSLSAYPSALTMESSPEDNSVQSPGYSSVSPDDILEDGSFRLQSSPSSQSPEYHGHIHGGSSFYQASLSRSAARRSIGGSSTSLITDQGTQHRSSSMDETDTHLMNRLSTDAQSSPTDLIIAEKAVVLIARWPVRQQQQSASRSKDDKVKLHVIGDLNLLASDTGVNTKHLRSGGTLRLTLRMIHFCLLHGMVNRIHLDCITDVIQSDVDALGIMKQFADLWAITGEVNTEQDYVDRLLYVTYILLEVLDKSIPLQSKQEMPLQTAGKQKQSQSDGMPEDVNRILHTLNGIRILGRDMFQTTFKSEKGTPDGNMLLSVLCRKEPARLEEWANIMGNAVLNKHFARARKKVDAEEMSFRKDILDRSRYVVDNIKARKTKESSEEKDYKDKSCYTVRHVSERVKQQEQRRMHIAKQKLDEIDRTGSRLWKRIIRNVADERGPWGAQTENSAVKWKLDKTENSVRMRLKLKRDFSNVDHSDAALARRDADDDDAKILKNDDAEIMADEFKNELLQIKQQGSFFIPKLAIVKEGEDRGSCSDEMSSSSGDGEEDSKSLQENDAATDEDTVIALDKSRFACDCEFVTPMQAFSGRIDVSAKCLIWYADKENKVEQFGVNEVTAELLKVPKDRVIMMDTIREIHFRRYRLRRSGIEIFMTNQTSIFLNLSKTDNRSRLFKRILQAKPPNLIYTPSVTNPIENVHRSGITNLWRRGLISNFDYLMRLNTFAGRSYNDLSQYPVFPWILSDYESETIDLEDEKVYRDLSKPIGALNPKRLELIEANYESFIDPLIPSFHYGSHYSSSGIVLYYLVRLEPYTTYFRILQGGKFDHADRMFDSLPQTYRNVLTGSDYKELVPEFFYQPEVLMLQNGVNLGTKQNGRKLDDIILPAWASSAEEFIRINRAALESDYVSEHLSEWVDLIFGFKQRGKEAVEAHNVFYYLTYEGSVDIDAITNPRDRRAVIAQLENFGQTPSQLFTKRHPKRLKREEMISISTLNPIPSQFQIYKTISNSSSAIVQIRSYSDKVVMVTELGVVYVVKYAFGSPCTLDILQRKPVSFPFSHEVAIDGHCFALSSNYSNSGSGTVMGDSSNSLSREPMLFSAGHWDASFRCGKPLSNSNAVQSIWRHKDLVSCVAVDELDRMVVVGSKDTTLTVWDIDQSGSSNKSPVNTQPRNILYGHDDEVTCLAVCGDLDMVVSGSKDCTCIVHTLREGRYVRTIKHPSGGMIDMVAISPETGHIVIYSHADISIHLYNINGKLLKSVDTNKKINSLIIHDSRYVIYGGVGGVVTIRNLSDLSQASRYDISNAESISSPEQSQSLSGEKFEIMSIAITQDEKFMFIGLRNGRMVACATNLTLLGQKYK